MENENMQFPQEEGNSSNAEPTAEIKKGILLTPGKLVGLIIGVVVLVAVLVGAIVYGMGGFNKEMSQTNAPASTPTAESVSPETVPEETVPATIPADTGLEDVTHKGSYTVSDEDVVELADRVVARVGNEVLTVADLQVQYWMQVQNFMYNYSYYLSYVGLDYTQNLDTQISSMSENGYTWQQYFLDAALQNWHNYQAMSIVSKENGFEITGEDREYLDSLAEMLETSAVNQGFADARELLAYNVGPGADVERYVAYEELYIQGFLYYQEKYDSIAPTLEELEAYFAQHEEEYAQSGVTKDGTYVDVRHILIVPEGKNPGDEYTEEEWEAIRVEAQAVLDEWISGEKTEESFGELANTYSADSDGTDGGLYQDVYQGQMVTNFNDWCFDENRQTGDTDLVQTEFGYHVMYFVDSTPIWLSCAESDLVTELANRIVSDACESYPMEVDYSAIALGEVDIAKWFEY